MGQNLSTSVSIIGVTTKNLKKLSLKILIRKYVFYFIMKPNVKKNAIFRNMLNFLMKNLKIFYLRGAWMAQSGKCPTSAQVMISQFVSSSLVSGSMLTAQSLEPASGSVSPSLSAPPPLMLCLCLSQK